MALKPQRLEREVDELADRVTEERTEETPREPARWLSRCSGPLLLYGRPRSLLRRRGGRGERARRATWAVRLGWLALTALLAVQAADDDGALARRVAAPALRLVVVRRT
jgi:hypothetical protein